MVKTRSLLGVLILSFIFPLAVTAGDVQVGQEVLRAAKGSGPNDIGVSKAEESNPEGPMSFVVNDSGKIYILDQVNSRIQVFEGGVRIKTIPAARTYSDIDLSAQGRIFLLERDIRKIIVSIDHAGTLLTKAELLGTGIVEAYNVRGIDSRSDGVWANLATQSVRMTDADGNAAADRIITEGHYSVTGRYLVKSKIIGEVTANVMRRAAGSTQWDSYTVVFDQPIGYLTGLYTDSADRIYLGAYLIEHDTSSEIVVVLGSNGQEERRILMPPASKGPEMNRTLRVAPDGTIYQLGLDSSGVVVRKYAP